MTIHLPEDLERFLRREVASGRFASEEEAISEAVRLLRRSEGMQSPLSAGSAENSGTAELEMAPWQRVLEIMKDLPDEIFDRIPADSSTQLDHYLYGSPKRPNA